MGTAVSCSLWNCASHMAWLPSHEGLESLRLWRLTCWAPLTLSGATGAAQGKLIKVRLLPPRGSRSQPSLQNGVCAAGCVTP